MVVIQAKAGIQAGIEYLITSGTTEVLSLIAGLISYKIKFTMLIY